MSSREVAILTWIVLVIVLMLVFPTSRIALIDIFKSAGRVVREPACKIIICYQLIAVSFLYILISYSQGLSLWLIKDYSIVFIASIFPFMVNGEVRNYYKSILECLTLGTMINYFISNHTFSYKVEVIIVLVVSVLIVFIASIQLASKVNFSLHFLGWLLLLFAIYIVVDDFEIMHTVDYWYSFVVDPIALFFNLPLIFLGFPLMQFDILDNFKTSKKTSLRLLKDILIFELLRVIHIFNRFRNINDHIIEVKQSGVGGKMLIIIVKEDTPSNKIRIIQNCYRFMMTSSKRYPNNKKLIPYKIIIMKDSPQFEMLSRYEMKGLQAEYMFDGFDY